jgi:hypothetical protein
MTFLFCIFRNLKATKINKSSIELQTRLYHLFTHSLASLIISAREDRQFGCAADMVAC